MFTFIQSFFFNKDKFITPLQHVVVSYNKTNYFYDLLFDDLKIYIILHYWYKHINLKSSIIYTIIKLKCIYNNDFEPLLLLQM